MKLYVCKNMYIGIVAHDELLLLTVRVSLTLLMGFTQLEGSNGNLLVAFFWRGCWSVYVWLRASKHQEK